MSIATDPSFIDTGITSSLVLDINELRIILRKRVIDAMVSMFPLEIATYDKIAVFRLSSYDSILPSKMRNQGYRFFSVSGIDKTQREPDGYLAQTYGLDAKLRNMLVLSNLDGSCWMVNITNATYETSNMLNKGELDPNVFSYRGSLQDFKRTCCFYFPHVQVGTKSHTDYVDLITNDISRYS